MALLDKVALKVRSYLAKGFGLDVQPQEPLTPPKKVG